MANSVRIAVRTLSELEVDPGWDDPGGIARFTREKLRAFRTNPLRGGDDDPAQLVALVGDRVVGRVDVFRGEVTAFGEIVPFLWGSALQVPPPFRTTAAGAMLTLRMSSLGLSVGGCGFSRAALPIYQGLRWTPFEMPRWILLRRSRAVFEKLLGPAPQPLRRPAARGLALGADPVLAAVRTLRGFGLRPRAGLVAREAATLPLELDDALASRRAPIFAHRSSRQLTWLAGSTFGHEPVVGPTQRHLFVVEDDGGAVVAYFLVKVRFHEEASQQGFRDVLLGSLQDWFVFDERHADVQSVVLLAVQELLRRRVDAIELIEAEPEIGDVARRLGSRRVSATHFMFRPARGSRLAAPDAAERGNWRITPAEGDNVFG